MIKRTRSFIIRFYNDEHGMRGTFGSVQEAVDFINEYESSLKACGILGAKRVRWIVVCEDRTRITNGGAFIHEDIHRHTVANVHYCKDAGKYVCEEVGLQSVD